VDLCPSLRAGQPTNHGSLSGRGNKHNSSPKCPDRLWGPRSFRFSGHLKYFLSGKATTMSNISHWPTTCRFQRPCGLRQGSSAADLLGLWVSTLPETCLSVCCECCVLSCRGLWFGLITRPEKSYRVWCAWVWSWSLDNEEPLAHWGLLGHGGGGGGGGGGGDTTCNKLVT
jgi:hypothetical protein